MSHMWLWYYRTNKVDMCDTIFEKGKKTNPTRKVINFVDSNNLSIVC